jgi:MtN3 and saliva related transmembrane protein
MTKRMDDVFTFIGYLAGTLTTLAFLPQVFQTYKSKSVGDFSWKMLIAFNCGLVLWLIYGVYLHSWPMILANGVTIGLQAFIVRMKIKYRK